MLAYAQELVYNLKELMPTQYQKDNFDAMLGLFLSAQGEHPNLARRPKKGKIIRDDNSRIMGDYTNAVHS